VAESGALPSFMEQIAAAIPDDLASLRPEDIRVEAEFADLVVTSTPPAPPPVEISAAPEPVARDDAAPPSEVRTEIPAPLGNASPVTAGEPPLRDQSFSSLLPEINIETPTILPKSRELRPVHEVVLQPATVLAWSLLVLLSLPMAFLAGLLIGHYIWK
jgi:hypothetical protein